MEVVTVTGAKLVNGGEVALHTCSRCVSGSPVACKARLCLSLETKYP